MIQSMLCELILKTTSLSLVAFERSTEAGIDSAENSCKLSVWTQMPHGRTGEGTTNIERFKCARTLLH